MVDTVIDKILDGLYSTTTAIEGLRFLDKFTTDEANDFARRIAVNLNKYPEDFIELTRKRVLDEIHDETREGITELEVRRLMRGRLQGNLNEHTHILLIYWLMLDYSYKYPSVNITEKLEEVYNFFQSYRLESIGDVVKQVEDKVLANTIEVADGYVRVSDLQELVPTELTKQNYFNYLKH